MKKLNNICALLLDVDGTIFSSERLIHEVYAEEFGRYRRENGRPERIPALPEIMAEIGKPVCEIFSNLVPELSRTDQDCLSDRILSNLVSRIAEGQGEHYEGVRETVAELARRGYLIFPASNGRLPYVEAILKYNRTIGYFRELPHVDNVAIGNKNELVAYILREHGLSAATALMVGDRASDRDAALTNGCPFAACLFGHGSAEEHAGAAIELRSFRDLLDVLPPASLNSE